MEELVKIIIGIAVLVLGVPIGTFLARVTKDEKKQGRFWFRLITMLALLGGFLALIFRNDTFLFAFFFIAIVASQSLGK
jgi:hypothetical protein